jgi:hypothetical protein
MANGDSWKAEDPPAEATERPSGTEDPAPPPYQELPRGKGADRGPVPAVPRVRARAPGVLIVGLIAVGLGLIAAGLVRDGGDESSDPTAPASSVGTSTTTPAPAPTTAEPPDENAGRTAPRPQLQRREIANLFSIGTPAGWSEGVSGAAVALQAPGGQSELQIYFEAGERSLGALAESGRGFVASQFPDATVGRPARVRIGGTRGIRVRARQQNRRLVAELLTASGYTYLLLLRIDRGASPATAAEGRAALASFRPV